MEARSQPDKTITPERFDQILTSQEMTDKVYAYTLALDILLPLDIKSAYYKELAEISVAHFGFMGICTLSYTRYVEVILALKWIVENNADPAGVALINAYYQRQRSGSLWSTVASYLWQPTPFLSCRNGVAHFDGKTFNEMLGTFSGGKSLSREQLDKATANTMALLARYSYDTATHTARP